MAVLANNIAGQPWPLFFKKGKNISKLHKNYTKCTTKLEAYGIMCYSIPYKFSHVILIHGIGRETGGRGIL